MMNSYDNVKLPVEVRESFWTAKVTKPRRSEAMRIRTCSSENEERFFELLDSAYSISSSLNSNFSIAL